MRSFTVAALGFYRKRGFSLVEIMIVISIMAILLSIAIPNMFAARANARARTCVANLREIEEAKEQCAMARNLPSGADLQISDIVPTYLQSWPKCPGGGDYDINAVDAFPTCSLGGRHSLQMSAATPENNVASVTIMDTGKTVY